MSNGGHIEGHKACGHCKEVKPFEEFYIRKGRGYPESYCKQCNKIDTIKRQRKFKKQCIEYKGGQCFKCGYNSYDGALEFHHLDPGQKDVSISRMRTTKFSDKTKKELDKCILLCSNCHREEHARQRGLI